MLELLLAKKIVLTAATVSMFRVAPGTDVALAVNTNVQHDDRAKSVVVEYPPNEKTSHSAVC